MIQATCTHWISCLLVCTTVFEIVMYALYIERSQTKCERCVDLVLTEEIIGTLARNITYRFLLWMKSSVDPTISRYMHVFMSEPSRPTSYYRKLVGVY